MIRSVEADDLRFAYRIEIKKLLNEPAHGSEARNVAIWLLRQKGALTLREIGVLFGGIDYAAVSQRVRRVDQHMAKHNRSDSRRDAGASKISLRFELDAFGLRLGLGSAV